MKTQGKSSPAKHLTEELWSDQDQDLRAGFWK
jgi:hypothetical protein